MVCYNITFQIQINKRLLMTKFIIFLTTFLFLHFKALALETKGVITTIQPINSLVSAVIGNTGKTISLIPAEISPHEFKLKPSDAKKNARR